MFKRSRKALCLHSNCSNGMSTERTLWRINVECVDYIVVCSAARYSTLLMSFNCCKPRKEVKRPRIAESYRPKRSTRKKSFPPTDFFRRISYRASSSHIEKQKSACAYVYYEDIFRNVNELFSSIVYRVSIFSNKTHMTRNEIQFVFK